MSEERSISGSAVETAVIPSIEEIEATRERLGNLIRETPVWEWKGLVRDREFGPGGEVFFKLELLQFAGSFKPRGALTRMLNLSKEELAAGVTTVSAGNHAMATSYAARVLNTTAKVVMPSNANPARVKGSRDFGAEVVLVENVHEAFAEVERIQKEEGRIFVHPFEGSHVALGTATLGMEFCRQVPDMEAVIIPIGGGGLCAGMASAIKRINPSCAVYGVEPEGADTMHRSFESGQCESIEKVTTIADSLGAPYSTPYSMSLCQQNVDELVMIDDDQICRAMAILFKDLKFAVEPAGAASTAALLGPLKEKLAGKRVGLILCGANIDIASFNEYINRGLALLDA